MKIRQHKILTRTLLILFIINFTLAAPTAVRERPEVRLDANVRRDVTAGPQKRWDPLDEERSTNVPRAGDALPPGAPPPILDSTGWVQRYPIPLSATNARPLSAPPPGLRPPSAPAPRPQSPGAPSPSAPLLREPALRPWPLRLLPPLPQPPSAPSPSAPLLREPALRPRPLRLRPPIAPSLSSPPPGLQPPSALPSGLRPLSAPTGLGSPSLHSTNWAQGVRMTLSAPNAWPPSAPPPSAPPGLRPPSTPPPSASPTRPLLPPPRPPRPLLSRPLPFLPPPPRIRRPMGRPARQRPPPRRPLRPLLPKTPSQTGWIYFSTSSAKTLPLPLAERPGSSIGNVLPSPGPPTGSRLPVESMPVAGSLTSPPPLPHTSQPGPSEDRFPKPPGFSENSDASSSIGNQPRPGVNSETHSVPNSGDLSPEFWNNLWNEFPSGIRDDFLKGKIKPRTFDSDAVPEEPKIIEICMGRESGMSIQDGNFD